MSSNKIRNQKRIDRFIKVFDNIKKHNSDVEKIILTNTERHLMPFYFNASSLHILTSDFEGSPNSVKEAMSCNTPVVSTPVGNVEELLEKVDGSYTTEDFSVKNLTEMSIRVLNNSYNNGRKVLINDLKLDIKNVSENLLEIYKKVKKV